MRIPLSHAELCDWQEKPWLTFLSYGCLFLGLAIFILALAFWRAPTWRAQLMPMTQLHGHIYQYSAPPRQTWLAKTPSRDWFPPAEPSEELSKEPAEKRANRPAYTGVPRWVRNASSANLVAQPTRKIAIVLDDIGVHGPLSAAAIEQLPPSITFAFLSYGRSTPYQAQLARLKGHEIMIHLPMEPESTADPGPNAILAKMSPAAVQQNTNIHLDALKNLAVGVNNHMGSKITQRRDIMEIILNELAREKLFFLDSVTTSRPASRHLAAHFDIPIMHRDVFIDHFIDETEIASYLHKLERIAARDGTAIGIGHPHPETVRALLKWLPTLEARGFQVVPITQVMAEEAL